MVRYRNDPRLPARVMGALADADPNGSFGNGVGVEQSVGIRPPSSLSTRAPIDAILGVLGSRDYGACP